MARRPPLRESIAPGSAAARPGRVVPASSSFRPPPRRWSATAAAAARPVRRHPIAGLGELVGGLELAVGGDDAGAALAFGLRLPRHRPLQRLRQRHVLDLHPVDMHTPGDGGTVDHQFQAAVELFAVGEQIVQLALADDRSQRGLGHLFDGEQIVLHLDHRLHRVDHPEIHHRVHPHGHVVAGNALLSRNRHRDDLHGTLRILSANGMSSRSPGSRAARTRPNRNTSPRSYC